MIWSLNGVPVVIRPGRAGVRTRVIERGQSERQVGVGDMWGASKAER